jgi:hypothetical protein
VEAKEATAEVTPEAAVEAAAVAIAAAIGTAEKSLREVDTVAAFELEQEIFRSGLRGEALTARVATEVEQLKREWISHLEDLRRRASDDKQRHAAHLASARTYALQSIHAMARDALSQLRAISGAAAHELAAISAQATARHASQMQRRSWAAAAAAAAAAGSGNSPGDSRKRSCARGGEQAAVSAATLSFGSVRTRRTMHIHDANAPSNAPYNPAFMHGLGPLCDTPHALTR